MSGSESDASWGIARRDFLCAAGAAAAGIAWGPRSLMSSAAAARAATGGKKTATVRVAFLYPSSASLEEAGYYSWPGSGFDAEGHQRQYAAKITDMARRLNVQVEMGEQALHDPASVARFINEVKQRPPDGLLLIPFKKSDWASVIRIIDETAVPTIAMATLGILLMPHVKELEERTGTYAISSLDNFGAIEYGLRMIRTIRWMKEALLLSVTGEETGQSTVDKIGTRVQVVPMQRLVDVYRSTETTAEVKEVAQAYLSDAKERREPTEADVLEAARAYEACKRLIADEGADAIMVKCLEGIRNKQIPPPCMAYMSLRDAGVVAGCQNDLDATLTMMLVQQLFDKPGFQQNASCDTEKNLYFGAHCTCASKLSGTKGPAEPYILRDHAEAGVGTVPQVLWPTGREVTMAHYLTAKEDKGPEMLVYTGKVVGCIDTPPAGGCRTNVILRINEVDACDVRGMHQTVFYGNYARQLRAFCQLIGVQASV